MTAGLPAAVLWDMDGTLIDGERLWVDAAERTAGEFGFALTEGTRLALVGVDIDTTVELVLGDMARPATAEVMAAVRERLVAAVAALYAEGVEWMPGAREALHTVRASGMRTALVTNTIRSIADLALDGLGRHYFDVTVCGDEVPSGKPAPDPYLRAAQLLGVDPAHCLAIEDSPTGALSAERAGAAVLVVPGAVPVPSGPRRSRRTDLVGLTLFELAAATRRSPQSLTSTGEGC